MGVIHKPLSGYMDKATYTATLSAAPQTTWFSLPQLVSFGIKSCKQTNDAVEQ